MRPASGAEGRTGVSALVRGCGGHLGFGNPPRSADVFVCVERLTGVDEFDAADGVCHAAAGTTLAEVRETVAARGWELPLDPPGERTSVGGTLAAAAVGPRALGFGLPRDGVLGLEVVLANGERTRCGGRVVKNVSGYDLGKLYTGSLGTLGVIEGAWLRLRPRPATTRMLEMGFAQLAEACAAGLAAARRDSARAVALASAAPPDGEGFGLVLEFAGRTKLYVPSSKNIRELMLEMRKKGTVVAIVVDEFGGAEGLVSMEDIMEEVVEDLEDEYDAVEDQSEEWIKKIGTADYRVNARIEIDELCEKLKIDLPRGNYATLAGLLLDKMHSVPHQGTVIKENGNTLTVQRSSAKSVRDVRIQW